MTRHTQAELARELGVSRQAIHKLVDAGVLTVGEDGRLDAAQARRAIENNVHPGSKTAQNLQNLPATLPDSAGTGAGSVAGSGPIFAPLEGVESGDVAAHFQMARTMRETEEAQIARMRREVMEGTLIRKDSVLRVAGTVMASTREALLQLPARLTPLVTPETTAERVHALIEAELHLALRQLHDLAQGLAALKDEL